MDTEQFRVKGKEMVDYICDYMNGLGSRRVSPDVEPGYLKKLIPSEAPQTPDDWDSVMKDVDDKIMQGVCHWQHPRFHAYFPAGNSYPAILADMLSDALGSIGFSWCPERGGCNLKDPSDKTLAANPVCTELETIVLDWYGKALNLPEEFLASSPGCKGGGVIQGSASECILTCMLAARHQAIQALKVQEPHLEDSAFLPRLVAYCSTEAHSSMEKAAKLSLVKLRILEPDDKCSLRGDTLRKAMEEDEANGLVPFFVLAVVGSTSSCAFDNLSEIGQACRQFPNIWFHVDGAYAGNSFICPENRYLMNGMHYADSFNTNPNKWLLVCFDCSAMWVKDSERFTSAMIVDPLYLQHKRSCETIDYRHWGIPLSRRFRSLKLWFVFRNYGIQGLQSYIRNHCRLAKKFEELVRKDSRFEVVNEVKMGLVCFRLKGTDRLNQDLLALINVSGKLHMIPSLVKGKYIIRFCVVAEHATDEDIEHGWEVIQEHASALLDSCQIKEDSGIKITELVKPPLKPKLSRRMSFTRSVSREVYRRSLSRSSLHDGATPITVPDDADNIADIDDVFQSGLTINEEDSS